MMLAARKIRHIEVMFREPANLVAAFPSIGVFENLLQDQGIRRKARHKRIDIAGIERPGVFGEQIVDSDSVGNRE